MNSKYSRLLIGSVMAAVTGFSVASLAEEGMVKLSDELEKNIDLHAQHFCDDSTKASILNRAGEGCEAAYRTLFTKCAKYDPEAYARGSRVAAKPELLSIHVPPGSVDFVRKALEECVVAEAGH